jgi:hypothetical protein
VAIVLHGPERVRGPAVSGRQPTDGGRIAGQLTGVAEAPDPGQRSLERADHPLEFGKAREVDHGEPAELASSSAT